jgi:hypothetical protein
MEEEKHLLKKFPKFKYIKKKEKPVIIPAVITLIILMIILILNFILFFIKRFQGKYLDYLKKENWEKRPITDIQIFNLNVKNKPDTIDKYQDKEIKIWKNRNFYIQRNLSTNYYKMLKKTKKKCGVDSYGNYLYVSENEYCPLNFVKFIDGFNNSKCRKCANQTLDGNYNLSCNNFSTDQKIIVNFNVGGIFGCGICYSIEGICDNEDLSACKYKQKLISPIDSMSLDEYYKENNIPYRIKDDIEIELSSGTYIGFKHAGTKLGDIFIKGKNLSFELLSFFLFIISGICILIILMIDNKLLTISLSIFSLLISIGNCVLFNLNYCYYHLILTEIIPSISHPIKDKYMYYHSYKIDSVMIVFSFIYVILNIIILIFLIFCFKNKKFRCTFLDYSILNKYLSNIICYCGFIKKEKLKEKIKYLNEIIFNDENSFSKLFNVIYESNENKIIDNSNDKIDDELSDDYDKLFQEYLNKKKIYNFFEKIYIILKKKMNDLSNEN